MAQMNFVSNWEGVESVPKSYICPPENRPVGVVMEKTIPVLDFATNDRPLLFQKILDSTHQFGFFQVINHGVPKELVEETMSIFKEFHSMPPQDKRRECSKDDNSCSVFTSSHNYANEQTHFWRDCLTLTCYPLHKNIHFWPENPLKFREVVKAYCVAMERFSWEILELISEGLGLGRGYFKGEMSSYRRMSVNHYPLCPNPSLTLGLYQHCDKNLITILFQDVNGLQVLKDGHWISIDPIDGAFLINFGYLLEVISNGKLKATEHRVVTNSKASRQSLGYFIFPEKDVIIEPAKCLINEANPPYYRSFKLEDFTAHFVAVSANKEKVMKYILA